jgi:hypothetical protein
MLCPYCKKNAGRVFHTGGSVICSNCDEELVKDDGPDETKTYVKCQFCGYEPVPFVGRDSCLCPRCGKLVF